MFRFRLKEEDWGPRQQNGKLKMKSVWIYQRTVIGLRQFIGWREICQHVQLIIEYTYSI